MKCANPKWHENPGILQQIDLTVVHGGLPKMSKRTWSCGRNIRMQALYKGAWEIKNKRIEDLGEFQV